jgi:hypothetical protein
MQDKSLNVHDNERDIQLPPTLEQALRSRSGGADAPLLAEQVAASIAAREQARLWLQAHRGGLLRNRRPRTARQNFAALSAPLRNPRLWQFAGAAVLAALVGYAVVAYAPLLQQSSSALPVPLQSTTGMAAAAGAMLALCAMLALQWPRLRQYYL